MTYKIDFYSARNHRKRTEFIDAAGATEAEHKAGDLKPGEAWIDVSRAVSHAEEKEVRRVG